MTKREYAWFMLLLWSCTCLWLTALIVINVVWHGSLLIKTILTLLLVSITPTDGLFTLYVGYRRWYAEHVANPW